MMHRKNSTAKIVAGTASGLLLLFLVNYSLWLTPRANDLSQVRIGFGGYETVNGERRLVLVVTNGSSFHITPILNRWELCGASPDGAMVSSNYFFRPGVRTPGWLPEKIPTVPPTASYRFTIPLPELELAYTWHVAFRFNTVLFRDRLPPALGSRWPLSKEPRHWTEASSPPILPAAVVLSSADASRDKYPPQLSD